MTFAEFRFCANSWIPLFATTDLAVIEKFNSFGMDQRAEMLLQLFEPFRIGVLIGDEHQWRIA
jgi:hypothetical protein